MPVTDPLTISPATAPLRGTLNVPPSKNYTSRWLWTSALCAGETMLSQLPESDDAKAMVHCCRVLGATIETMPYGVSVHGFGDRPRGRVRINPDNAGAVLRFVMGVAALGGEYSFETKHHESLGTRPNRDLVDALAGWGVRTDSAGAEATLPIDFAADRPAATPGGGDANTIAVRGSVSSQYLSSLLMIAPVRAALCGAAQTIEIEGELRSRPAIDTTLDVMRARGINVEEDQWAGSFRIEPGEYNDGAYTINGDWPSAAGILCAAAVVPGSAVTLVGLREDTQGERRVLDALRDAGCEVTHRDDRVTLMAPDRLRAFRLNGDLATDAVPALTAVAALADGTTRFEGVGNLRYKECDRIGVPLAELAKLGITGREEDDAFEVDGRPDGLPAGDFPMPPTFDGHADHRVLMLGAILALRSADGLSLATAPHIAKSYPAFFEDLARLRAGVEE